MEHFSFFKYFISLLLDRGEGREGGREGEREGEKHQCVLVSRASPTGDLTLNLGLCSRLELN